jgi:hypothetical protein
VQVLLIGHILIGDNIRVVSLISFGKLFVSQLVGQSERHTDEQDDKDLISVRACYGSP